MAFSCGDSYAHRWARHLMMMMMMYCSLAIGLGFEEKSTDFHHHFSPEGCCTQGV